MSVREFKFVVGAAAVLAFVVFHFLGKRAADQVNQMQAAIGEFTSVEQSSKDAPAPWLIRSNVQESVLLGTKLQAGNCLETRGAGVSLQYAGETTRLDIAADSIATFRDEDGAKQIQLDRGTLEADVARQPARRLMVLTTPHATAMVIGTQFQLSVTDVATKLTVTKGCVRFIRQADGVSTDVTAGQSADTIQVATLRPALLVVNSLKLNPSDEAIRERLGELGFLVTLKAAQEVAPAHAEGVALVLVSTSVHSGIDEAVKSLRSIRAPLMTWEWHLFDDYGMTGLQENVDYGTAPSWNHIVIVDPYHPLSAALSGSVQVTTDPMDLHWGKIGRAAAVIATVDGEPKHATIFGYEAGAEMVGMRAPARRVGLFMTDDSPSRFTPQGWALFDAAVRWCSSGKP